MSYRRDVLIPYMKAIEEQEDREKKFKDCLHPNTKQGCCDFCGKDLIGE